MSAQARDVNTEGPDSFDTFLATLIPTACVGTAVFSIYLLARKRMPEVYESKRKRLELEGDERIYNQEENEGNTTTDGSVPIALNTDIEIGGGLDQYQKTKLKRKKEIPEAIPNGLWSWISLLTAFTDEDLLTYIGTDGLMFIRFLKLCFSITFYMTIFGIAILLPMNINGSEGLTEFAKFTASNIEQKSKVFYVHFISVILFSGLTIYKLYQEYCIFTKYRQQFFCKPKPENYSILIRDIPKSITATKFVENVQRIYGKSGDLVSVTPLIHRKSWDQLEARRCKLIFQLSRAQNYLEQKGERPQHKVDGICCNLLEAETVDSIDYYQEQLEKVKEEIEELKKAKGKFLHSAIVSFRSLFAATSYKLIPIIEGYENVSKEGNSSDESTDNSELKVSMFFYNISQVTPAPNDLLVNNTGANFTTRKIARILSNTIALLIIAFFFVVVSFLVALVDLSSLQERYSWVKDILSVLPNSVMSLIQGLLPVVILSIVVLLIPPIMKFLASLQFLVSDSECENSAIMRVYVFNLINSFLVISIGGSLFSKISEVVDHPSSVFNLLATTLPDQATFFINFIMLAGLSNLPMEISRLPKLILVPLLKRVLYGYGDLEKISRWDSLSLLHEIRGFHIIYPFPLLIFLATLCFSSIAPLILPFGTAYFAFAIIVWTNQLVYVYTIDKDSGGSQFPIIFNCIMTCLFLYQALFIGVMSLKEMPTLASLTFLVLIISIYFCYLINKNFKTTLTKSVHAKEYSKSLHGGYVELTEDGTKQLVRSYGPPTLNVAYDEVGKSLSFKLCDPYGVHYLNNLDHNVLSKEKEEEKEKTTLS